MLIAVVLWFVLSFVGLVLPIFLGLALFLFITPVITGYVAGRSRKIGLVVIVAIITSILAGVIGLVTIGSVPPEQQRNVTGIGWISNTLILIWVSLNGLLTLLVGYIKFRYGRRT